MQPRSTPFNLIVILLAGILLVWAGWPHYSRSANAANDIRIIAHRGASGSAPENTLAAFDLAVERQADYVELDVQLSLDGELIVIHDRTLERTTNGVGYVGSKTAQQLRTLDAGSSFSAAFAGERIPLLEQVLDRYLGRVGLLVELKEPALYPKMEEKLAAVIKERLTTLSESNMDPLIIQSFDRNAVRHMHELLPGIATGVLIRPEQKRMQAEDWAAVARYADYINPHKSLVDKSFVEAAHAHGLLVMPWTVHRSGEARRLIRAGVDGLITDYP